MVDKIITRQELVDAQKDAQTLEDVINGAPNVLIETRLGRKVYTIASIPQINTMSRDEVTAAVTPKANKVDVDTALSNLSTTANKYYSTLAAANADIANIALNQSVTIGEDANSGLWYKATAGATSLTKSPYDPLNQAKGYADSKDYTLRTYLAAQDVSISSNLSKVNDLDYYELIDSVVSNKTIKLESNSVAKIVAEKIPEGNNDFRNLSINANGVNIFSDLLLPSETLANGIKTSIYKSVKFSTDLKITAVSEPNAEQVRINIALILADSTIRTEAYYYNVFDKTGVFYAERLSTSIKDPSKKYMLVNSTSKEINVFIPKNETVGYASTIDGMQSLFNDKYPNLVFHYATTSSATQTPYNTTIGLNVGDISVSNTYWHDITFYLFAKENKSSSVFSEYICDVLNDTVYDYVNHPIELKIDFEEPIANSKNQLMIEDENGNTYKAQFVGARSNNIRKRASIGYYPDGSYKVGSILFLADIAANTKKKFKLIVGKKVEHLAKNKLSKQTIGYSVAAYGNTFYFLNGTNILYKILNGSTNVDITHGLSFSEWNSAAQAQTGFSASVEPTIRVIDTGDVLTHVRIVVKSGSGLTITQGSLETIYDFIIFSNGHIQIKSQTSANVAIAPEKLFFKLEEFIVPSPNPTKDALNASALMTQSLPSKWSFVPVIVNGDSHREGSEYGIERPVSCYIHAQTTSSRFIYGWRVATPNEISFKTYDVKKDWTWTSDVWLNINEYRDDISLIAKATHNRPVGFLAKQFAQNVLIEKMNKKRYTTAISFAKWWTSSAANDYLGGENIANKEIYPFTFELGRFLDEGKGDFDTIYNKFKTTMQARHGQFSQLGNRYLSGGFATAHIFIVLTIPMELFYKAAVKLGKTTISNELKVGIESLARGYVTKANSNSGNVNIVGTSNGIAAMNLQTIALYQLALAIYVGSDTDGSILTAYDLIESTLLTTTAKYYYPIAFDDQWEAKPAAIRHYLMYEAIIANAYTNACRLSGRASIFNQNNQFIRAINGDGRFDEVNWCLSESRRGSMSLNSHIAQSFIYGNTLSSIAAAHKSALVGDEDWVDDINKAQQLYGYTYNHNKVDEPNALEFTRYIINSTVEHIRNMIKDF